MAKSKAPKPTQVYIEIDSDEEEEAPRLKGVARGLLTKNVIGSSATLSVESTNPSTATPSTAASGEKHVTRASRHGRAAVNYDMKLHPMDVVTRPNSAAVRRRSKSVSTPAQDTDEESVASSLPTLTDSSHDENEDDEEDEIASDSPAHQVTPVQRERDPRASRQSKRTAAQKPVDYSKKHHPQDRWLLGRSYAAAKSPAARSNTPKPSDNGSHRKRKAALSRAASIPDSDEDDENAIESIPARLSDDDDSDVLGRASARPPLRPINPNSRSAKRPRRSDVADSNSPQIISSTRDSSSDMDMNDAVQFADTALDPANHSPMMMWEPLVSAAARTSSATLDAAPSSNNPAPTAVMLAVVRPYFDPTAESRPSACQLSQMQEASAAPDDSLSKPGHGLQTIVREDSLTMSGPRNDSQASSNFQVVSVLHDAEITSQTPSERCDAEANAETMTEPYNVEEDSQSPSEQCDADDTAETMIGAYALAKSEQREIEAVSVSGTISEQRDVDDDSLKVSEQGAVEVNSRTSSERDASADSPSSREHRAVDAYSHTMSEQCDVEAGALTTSERRNSEANQQSSHFDDAMAITEGAVSGGVLRDQVNDDGAEQSSQLDDMPQPLITKLAGEDGSTPSSSLDPLDLLPKPSSYYPTTASFPSTAEPESDRASSEAADALASTVSREI